MRARLHTRKQKDYEKMEVHQKNVSDALQNKTPAMFCLIAGEAVSAFYLAEVGNQAHHTTKARQQL
ncbi:hypothetical protein AIN02nite_17260 [Acetobacter indonesiensis]|nr:hypothetical protein AIN02nite_17260 [Acetobacter indonesiensis]